MKLEVGKRYVDCNNYTVEYIGYSKIMQMHVALHLEHPDETTRIFGGGTKYHKSLKELRTKEVWVAWSTLHHEGISVDDVQMYDEKPKKLGKHISIKKITLTEDKFDE